MRRTRTLIISILVGCAVTVSGCGFTGINSEPLPLGPGSGDDAIEVTVEMRTVGNLVPNSEVKVDDLTVGQVRQIEFDDWTARLTLGLEPHVDLPADARAQIGQKSLLGAQYLELSDPGTKREVGRLTDGSTIPISRTGIHPDTEQTLTAAGVLLTGGGLENITTINYELNQALGGRETDWRALLKELNLLVANVNAQRHDLVALLDGSGQLAGKLAQHRATIRRALRLIPKGAAVLDDLRPRAVAALAALRRLSEDALPVLKASRDDLVLNLQDLAALLDGVGSAGDDLPGALGMATFPLPVDSVPSVVRGDYANLFLDLNLTLEALDENFLSGSPLEGVLSGINQLPIPPTSSGNEDPIQSPLDPPPSSDGDPDGGPSDSGPTPGPSPSPSESSSPAPGDLLDLLGLGGATG